jgi:xylulokinase
VPAASFTVTKLRWLAENEPERAARTASVLLPHDWLTWMLAGGPESGAPKTTDHGDASGTGYYSPARREWLPDVAHWALGRGPGDPQVELPRLAAPAEVVGHSTSGAALAAGTGDNMAAAVGLGLEPGDVAVSIGTSGTAFCVTDMPTADPSGSVAGFCDATGRYLPLVATVNAARVLAVVGELLGVDHQQFGELALSAASGAGGLTFLPYLDGERTPNRPNATGVIRGLTSAVTRADLARSAVEALLCSLADAVDALGVTPTRVLMIGGAARNPAVQQLAPAIMGADVLLPQPAEYVALGAARQAAWALAGTAEPPAWPAADAQKFTAEPTPAVRQQYATLRDATAGW